MRGWISVGGSSRDVRPGRCVMFPEGSRKVPRSLGFLSVRRCTELTMGAGTDSES